MKRAGFTMIELIFVIVILGILAAVAIPRLAATRNDASASTLATSAATCVNDAGSEYLMRTAFAPGLAGASCVDAIGSGCYTFVPDAAAGTLLVTSGLVADPVCAQASTYTDGNGLSAPNPGVTHQF